MPSVLIGYLVVAVLAMPIIRRWDGAEYRLWWYILEGLGWPAMLYAYGMAWLAPLARRPRRGNGRTPGAD